LRRQSGLLFLVIAVALVSTLTFSGSLIQKAYAQPSVIDDGLNVEAAVEGLSSPTSMTFLDDNNILDLENEELFALYQTAFYKNSQFCKFPSMHRVSHKEAHPICSINTSVVIYNWKNCA
jgi:hypothetical protein